jgi:N-ethylmaleimide reductase
MKKLFSPWQLGDIELKNRVVLAPLTRSRAVGNIPNELMAEYYGNRAQAGLLITEGTSPSPNGLGYARIPGIFSKEQIVGWRRVTQQVKERGGQIFVQLMHTGRVSHPLNLPAGAKILAPSAVGLTGQMWTDQKGLQPFPVPQEMTEEELQTTKLEFVRAAELAMEAGFAGVEIHAANGYLLEQFLHPNSNQRKDGYGGSIDNRKRFLLEVVELAKARIGANRIGVRLSPFGVFNDMGDFPGAEDFFAGLAKDLNDLGIVYLHLVDHSSMGAPAVPASLKERIRKNFLRTLIMVGGFQSAEDAEQAIVSGKQDLAAFGRAFIANPDLVEKLKSGKPLNPPHPETFYTPGREGYLP